MSYTVSGSFSRSATNYVSGAKRALARLLLAVVTVTLLWLTPLFYYLPQATLALIIIVSVANLIALLHCGMRGRLTVKMA